ncbi:alpha/beta hydrolase [Pyxidicoccus fallax]|uniref:Alpha/beta hydrolase n=1 Tax=Pyxidicoccus fallax TaxID=394095 RepID=A0A848LA62_9BACT|nr:alpha/beta hydrolase [Pyxidicoccus fallax]NMO13745.1 alpha/beta hydrolase [Pyxidicoccus fallax]NPC79591.1 alpha/beta hydrolase [Pyxidicoccus fallax]
MPEVRSSDGARIHYDDVGRGEPALLFIPGWCTTRAVYRDLLPRCASRRRVLSVDLRGHGASEGAGTDFDSTTVLDDLLAVIEASGARQVVPVGLSHAGWWAIELRRELGAERVPQLVLLDWIVTEPPPPFLDALRGLMSDRWREARDGLFAMWLQGVDDENVIRFVREDMGAFGEDMWARAAREIASAYAREGSPMRALLNLAPSTPTLHLYAQPESHDYLAGQVAFGVQNPWFHVMKLPAVSHYPTFEVPDLVAAGIEALVSARETYVNTTLETPGAAPV